MDLRRTSGGREKGGRRVATTTLRYLLDTNIVSDLVRHPQA